MSNWKEATLRDLVLFQRGFDITKAAQEPGNVPVVSSSGINSYHSVAKVAGPGVVIGRKGTLGSVHYLDCDFWPHDTTLWAKDFHGNDRKYVYYFIKTMGLERFDVGGANPTLNRNHIHRLPIKMPSVDIQTRIASTLSTYDDLIGNNRRHIGLLEQAAQELYKEWFVRLRFPGYAESRLIDGLPEGWEKTQIKQLCDSVDYGFTASASLDPIGPKFLRITDIVPSILQWDGVPHCSIPDDRRVTFLLRAGDIVVARTGATVGFAKRIHKRHPEAIFASYLVRLRPKSDALTYLVGLFVESDAYKQYIMANVGGAAQPNANAQVIAKADLLVPPEDIQLSFQELVEPMLDQRDVLVLQNARLAEARDLLLPRLMSGDIELSHASTD